MNKQFPNGFDSWQETHYEVVAAIEFIFHRDDDEHPVMQIFHSVGTGGLYELAEKLTDEFEEAFKGRLWDGDYEDTLHTFLVNKFKEL
jgi:hypothetical protein